MQSGIEAIQGSQGIALAHTTVNGLSIHHASAGARGKPLVLFLHGFPEAWFAWEAQLREFGRDHFAVAPDLPGCNLSDKSRDLRGYRAHVIAADLFALADALGYERFTLVGHDWGGAIAYTMAMAQPERVRRLFIINAVHPVAFARELVHSAAQAAHSQYMNRFRLEADLAATLQRDGCAWLCDFLSDQGTVPHWFDAATRARYIAAWSQPGALDGGLNYYRASPLYPALGDDPGAGKLQLDAAALTVKVPTMVLWGERDKFLLPGCLDGLASMVTDLRVHRCPQASHWLAHELPHVVNQRLREHMAS